MSEEREDGRDHEPVLELSLDRNEEKINLKLKGKVIHCVLRELDGRERDKFLNKMSNRTRTVAGRETISDATGIQAELVQMSMLNLDDGDRKFSLDEIQGWPAATQTILFAKAQRISRIGAQYMGEDGPEKN